MPTGSLTLEVTDLRRQPLQGRLRIEFNPVPGSAGGTPMRVEFNVDGHSSFTIDNVACRDVGTLYAVRVKAATSRAYSTLQTFRPGVKNLPSERAVRLFVDPKKVKRIDAPPFHRLPAPFRTGLEAARIQVRDGEDSTLAGLRGADLYDALNARPRVKACLLNLVAKASHGSADRIARFIRAPRILEQDRCFAEVDPDLEAFLHRSDRYTPAESALHKAPEGFERGLSFKSRDDHGNIQVTLMKERRGNAVWADIDIDEASGFQHGLEVVRNAVTDGRTDPFLIRDILLRTEFAQGPLDPGYDFVFEG